LGIFDQLGPKSYSSRALRRSEAPGKSMPIRFDFTPSSPAANRLVSRVGECTNGKQWKLAQIAQMAIG
jgi:hypothetical protein